MPAIELSITITAIIALVSLLSPIVVTIINNQHQYKIKKMESRNSIKEKLIQNYYLDKSTAFRTFLVNAGNYCSIYWNREFHTSMCASLENALLYCENTETLELLLEFNQYINNKFSTLRNDNKGIEDILEITNKLTYISIALNKELSDTTYNKLF